MNFETRLLISQAQTLRYLPPNTYLETDQAEDEQLLRELLSINSDLDPISWLMEAQARLCVKLLFWKILDDLRGNHLGLQRILAEETTAVNRSDLEAKLGYRINEHNMRLLRPLAYIHPLQVDADTLLSIFWQLKRELVPLSSSRVERPSLVLRQELLSLPRQVDPLQWLRENHLWHAAESTLHYIMHQVFPYSRRVAAERLPPESHFPNFQKIACESGSLSFYLSRFLTIHGVSAIELSFTISKKQVRQFDVRQEGNAGWGGIPALCDNLGHQYLIDFSGGELGVVFPIKWKLRFAVFPIIVAEAETFTLSFENVLLAIEERKIRGVDPSKDIRRFYELPLHNLNWRVGIGGLRRRYPGFY